MASSKYEKKVLKELQRLREEVDELRNQQQKQNKFKLPDGLQSAVRQVVKKLMADTERPLILDYERFQSNDIELVVTEVKRAFRGSNWGTGFIEAAYKKVWRNIRDEKRRREKGNVEKHRNQSKNAKRIKDKLTSRRKQLEVDVEGGFFDEKSAKSIQRVLVKEATSPEKTDDEDNTRRVSIPLIWESDRLTEVKRDLDRAYRERLSTKAKRLKSRVHRSTTETTDSSPPPFVPKWAIKETYREAGESPASDCQ